MAVGRAASQSIGCSGHGYCEEVAATSLEQQQLIRQHKKVLFPQSKPLTTINMHQGLYCYTRLPYGITLASAMFQMDVVLHNIPQVCCYIDDIIVSGKDDADHLEHLQEVLERLEKFGLCLNWIS